MIVNGELNKVSIGNIFKFSNSFCHFFIALSMIRCSKSADKSAVQVCQVDTVVMETTQLVLRQFKNFL